VGHVWATPVSDRQGARSALSKLALLDRPPLSLFAASLVFSVTGLLAILGGIVSLLNGASAATGATFAALGAAQYAISVSIFALYSTERYARRLDARLDDLIAVLREQLAEGRLTNELLAEQSGDEASARL
jgi:hypothetical protein